MPLQEQHINSRGAINPDDLDDPVDFLKKDYTLVLAVVTLLVVFYMGIMYILTDANKDRKERLGKAK